MDRLLDSAPCGYVAFNDEGVIRTVNATLAEMLGYSSEELQGKHFESLLTKGARIFYHTHFFPVLKLHGEAEEVYLTLATRSGTNIPVLTNGVRREVEGEMVSECIVVRMLQRAQYEEELLRAKRTAEAASDAKAKFLSMMSHELRAPLQAISGYCELLLGNASGSLNEEQEDDLRAIQSASNELVRLMNDILDFAKVESGAANIELGVVSIDAALARAEALIKPKLLEAQLHYSRGTGGTELYVYANADRLQHVLLNLLTNAMKFTSRGGQVSIECKRNDHYTSLAIRDTGCGIPAEHLGRIFDPFVQVDPHRIEDRQRGVGLGLAICRELVEAMKGQLTVESEVGLGSIFTIALPTASKPVVAEAVSV
jgi:PAS domain S-box-containing protein